MQVGGVKALPQSRPAKSRSLLPVSQAQVHPRGATPARRAAGHRAEVHPWSRSRKPGGPSSLVIPGLKRARAGPQGHSRAQLRQRRREGGQGRRGPARRSAAEGEEALACEPPVPPGSAARADWQECRPGTGSSRCPSPVKPRQQLRVLCERAEQPREPEPSERGAAACGETSFRPGGREKGAGLRLPAREPADTRGLGPFLTRVRCVTLDCTVSPASISHLHTERVGQAPARGHPTAVRCLSAAGAGGEAGHSLPGSPGGSQWELRFSDIPSPSKLPGRNGRAVSKT